MLESVITVQQLLDSSTISLTKLTDTYAELTDKTKKDAREELEEILAPFIARGPDITCLQRKRGVSERDILATVPQVQMLDTSPKPE